MSQSETLELYFDWVEVWSSELRVPPRRGHVMLLSMYNVYPLVNNRLVSCLMSTQLVSELCVFHVLCNISFQPIRFLAQYWYFSNISKALSQDGSGWSWSWCSRSTPGSRGRGWGCAGSCWRSATRSSGARWPPACDGQRSLTVTTPGAGPLPRHRGEGGGEVGPHHVHRIHHSHGQDRTIVVV